VRGRSPTDIKRIARRHTATRRRARPLCRHSPRVGTPTARSRPRAATSLLRPADPAFGLREYGFHRRERARVWRRWSGSGGGDPSRASCVTTDLQLRPRSSFSKRSSARIASIVSQRPTAPASRPSSDPRSHQCNDDLRQDDQCRDDERGAPFALVYEALHVKAPQALEWPGLAAAREFDGRDRTAWLGISDSNRRIRPRAMLLEFRHNSA
jgi:hypothetical protein